MAQLDMTYELQESDMEDDRPIALRRKRRSSSCSTIASSPVPAKTRNIRHGISTPPATPQRSKKRVRFSDPGPAIPATGLTPFIRRTSLGTPSSRRHSSSSNRWNLNVNDTPFSGTLQFEPLRQVLEGRVQRRLRRNRLSEEVNIIESEKRQVDKARRETAALKAQLEEKDREIAELREEQDVASQIGEEAGIPIVVASRRVNDLEAEVAGLRAELAKRHVHEQDPDWTLAARDPFNDDDDFTIPGFEDEFHEDMSDIIISTPCRRAFPSPPVTAPTTPSQAILGVDAMVQASMPDMEHAALLKQLETLDEEVTALQTAIELTNTTHERLVAKLCTHVPDTNEVDAALDKVLTDLALFQSSATDNLNRFTALSTELTTLGFSKSPESTIKTLHAQFRHARIEFERLNPGETPEGFDNSKLLDLLLNRIKVLTKRVQEQDEDIDQYHEQELSLRQQISDRVDVMRAMEATLSDAHGEIVSLASNVSDRESSIEKLTRALDGYRNEVSGLEALITRMETEHNQATHALETAVAAAKEDGVQKVLNEQLTRDFLQASYEGQEILVTELSNRLSSTISTLNELQLELQAKDSAIAGHGQALALRDARVTELRVELERVNANLKDAHGVIMSLRSENRGLEGQVHAKQEKLDSFMKKMQEQLKSVIDTANGFEHGEGSTAGRTRTTGTSMGEVASGAVVKAGEFLRGNLARKSGAGKKRRRYDSGLGFLDEGEEM